MYTKSNLNDPSFRGWEWHSLIVFILFSFLRVRKKSSARQILFPLKSSFLIILDKKSTLSYHSFRRWRDTPWILFFCVVCIVGIRRKLFWSSKSSVGRILLPLKCLVLPICMKDWLWAAIVSETGRETTFIFLCYLYYWH